MVTMNLLNNSVAATVLQEEHRNLMHKNLSARKKRRVGGILSMLLASLTFLVLGILSTQFSLLEMTLDERARMRPDLPPYDMWVQPPVVVRMSMHIFAVANPNGFLDGSDAKLHLQEIGPIVYREHLRHENVTRHAENSTVTYTAVRWLEFLDDENEPGILNRTITVPNFALLSAASLFHEASFLSKLAFKALKISTGDTAFINITVYDYLWNYRSKLVQRASQLVPFMVPVENAGILAIIYSNLIDRYNIKSGDEERGHQFFQINTINGKATAPGYDDAVCKASVANSTEGVIYGQRMTPADQEVVYWRKTLCRTVPLYFKGELEAGPLHAFEYRLHNNSYDRFENASADCYKGSAAKPLPNGLSDLSRCFFGLPVAASSPHFFGREEIYKDTIDGLSPTYDQHVSYIILEPTLGIPIRQCAKSQSNLVIPNLRGLSIDLARFSDMVLPLFWLQYHLRELNTEITAMIIVIVRVLPIVQMICQVLLFVCSVVFLLISYRRFSQSARRVIGDRLLNGRLSCVVADVSQRRNSLVIAKSEGMVRHIVQQDESNSMRKNRV